MKKQGTLVVALAIGLVLGIAAGLIYAQESAPGQAQGPQGNIGPVSSKISYQGTLKENGQPVTGSRQLTFRLYTDPACTTQVGRPMTYTVPITFPLPVAVLLCSVLLVGTALAAGTPSIERHVIGGGGGHAEVGAVALDGTIGQPVVGIASNRPYELCAGFWCGVEVAHVTYLPIVMRNGL
jgi:hypothetical protein